MAEDNETWDEMAARVASEHTEEVSIAYAGTLMQSMGCYIKVGFSYDQAWQLTLAEHASRLDYMSQLAMHQLYTRDDDGEG